LTTRQVINFLVIESTIPHNITIEDIGDGNVMETLGIVRKGAKPPMNYHPEAKVFTINLFERFNKNKR